MYICTQVRTTVYGRGGYGVGGRRMVCVRHYKPCTPTSLGWEGDAQCISDLGGGVNGHDVNLRDKCGVCDDVTG